VVPIKQKVDEVMMMEIKKLDDDFESDDTMELDEWRVNLYKKMIFEA
jgi:hypothetical protein